MVRLKSFPTFSEKSKNSQLLTDDVELQPVLDFEQYGKTIADMIQESRPRFSVGIYGEWGTGKTTFMRLIEGKLQEHKKEILTVWFNAWRYEREEQLAIVALLKTVAYAMGQHPIYRRVRPILLRGLAVVGVDLLRQAASRVITEHGIEQLEKKLLPRLELLAEFDQKTLYFDGLRRLETEIGKIRTKYPHSRVVIFIDDLDRCSPRKALEVFESIKVFLDIEGFVYVIGLSHETISKLITAAYRESGVTGEKYIQKIIQMPIMVPDWTRDDIKYLIKERLVKRVGAIYSEPISRNSDLLAEALDPNPREIKRFINSFIIAFKIYSHNSTVKPRYLLEIQILKMRWTGLYRIISTNAEVRKLILKYVDMPLPSRQKALKRLETSPAKDPGSLLSIDNALWEFLAKHKEMLSLQNWGVYRRAVESVKEIPTGPARVIHGLEPPPKEAMVRILRHGKVAEFNRIRRKMGLGEVLDLTEAQLEGADLQGIDMAGVHLSGANLSGANLSRANLSRALLSETQLTKADLRNANLSGADLCRTDLTDADLRGARLDEADLSEAELCRSDLTGAFLIRAILTGADLDDSDLSGADFRLASGLPISAAEAESRGAIIERTTNLFL